MRADLPDVPSQLLLTRYSVQLEALAQLDLPAYLGSTLRGAFGDAFRRVACPGRFNEPCPVPDACPYHLVFETKTPSDSEVLRSFDEVPRPFVIAPPASAARTYPPGSRVCFDLTLIGRAREFFAYFVVALREVESLGRGRKAVALARIDGVTPDGTAAVVYDSADNLVRSHNASMSLAQCFGEPAPDRFRIRFQTFTRLKHEGQWARRPEFHVVFRRLLGRLSSLAAFHCGDSLDVDFLGLIEKAKAVRLVQDATRWDDWQRYSRRQDRRMVLGGLLGEATYEGPVEALWPYIVFGQWTHVGKGATFGMGRYEVEAQER